MNFSFIILIICFYIISQTSIDARTTGLGKGYWSLSTNGDYQGDLLHQKFDQKRQAGWGKRRDLTTEDHDDDLPPYHPYVLHSNSARTWFDDE